MNLKRKQSIKALLKSIETGESGPIAVVNQDKYIQHNPQTHEGGEGLESLFKRLSLTSPKVNIVRIFADGDYVFGHTEYEFSSSRVGFEVFRFEGEQAVEHWDNIQMRAGPNTSGRSMVDGPTESVDLDKTEANRSLVSEFVEQVLIARQLDRISEFMVENYFEHNSGMSDGVVSLTNVLTKTMVDSEPLVRYARCHRLLAEGNFVLSVCEGLYDGEHTSFYDLFRIEGLRIVEHWDNREKVAPKSDWKNDNGKF